MIRLMLPLLALVFAAVALPDPLVAQAGLPEPGALGSQTLRGYAHVFIAYAIAWLLIVGWIISMVRRLGKVERALED